MTDTVIGIDPGVNGGIAAVDVRTRLLLWAEDMPTVDGRTSGALLRDLIEREPGAPVAIEHVQYMGAAIGNGGKANFSLGDSFGGARCAAEALRREVVLMRPQTWKGVLGLNADKERSRRKAIELWTDHAHLFKNKSNVDRAEAALIALVHVDFIRRHGMTVPDDDKFPW